MHNRDTARRTSTTTHDFGHGRLRVLYDLAQTVDELIQQLLTFAAGGQMLAVHDSSGTIGAATAVLSSLGYSGELFDAAAQQQYLRARFYNPALCRRGMRTTIPRQLEGRSCYP